MSRATELLDAVSLALYGDRCIEPPQTDHAQHVMDALRLPDYEAAVEALDAVQAGFVFQNKASGLVPQMLEARIKVEAALARLREDEAFYPEEFSDRADGGL